MKRTLKNPNNHKKVTPSTKGKTGDDTKFTSYDTDQTETSTPQRARQSRESSSELARHKKSGGKDQG